MSTVILTNHRITDYASWRKVFDDHGTAQRDATMTNPQVYQNTADPNDLTITFDAGDAATVRKFIESDDLRDAMERAGVIDKGQFHLIE